MPGFSNAVDLIIFVPDPLDFRAQFCISLLAGRGFQGIGTTRQLGIVFGRCNQQNRADRLDTVNNALFFSEADYRFSGRSSSVPLPSSGLASNRERGQNKPKPCGELHLPDAILGFPAQAP